MKEFKKLMDMISEIDWEIENIKNVNGLKYDDLKYYLERLKNLASVLISLLERADSIASLLNEGKTVWLSENICFYYKEGKVMIKVTD
jgi:hypothetical protein